MLLTSYLKIGLYLQHPQREHNINRAYTNSKYNNIHVDVR